MSNIKYPKYYRLLGRCIKRLSETTGIEVRTPDNLADRFPLSMTDLIRLDKAGFDKEIEGMEEVDEDMYYQYVNSFLGQVEVKINKPMCERAIKKAMEENRFNVARK